MTKQLIDTIKQSGCYTNIAPGEIASLEAAHPGLKKIEVLDEKTAKTQLFCFRRPTRHEVRIAQGVLVKTRSAMDYADVLINACLLNGKDIVSKDDEVYFALQRHIEEIITDRISELKK